jgi:hypothetical protein
MRRSGSAIPQFVQRIPTDVRPRAIGRELAIPLGSAGTVRVVITERMALVRFSLRSRDPAEVKIRQAGAAAYLERTWQALRRDRPVVLTNRDAHALAGELYRAWADGRREGDLAAEHDPRTGRWVLSRPNQLAPDEEGAAFAAAVQRLTEAAESDGLEAALGPILDRLLLAKGIAEVDPECRPVLLNAFLMALQDAFANRERNAAGDFTPDHKAARFPKWSKGEAERSGLTITGLVEGWWLEAKARGLKPSTYESYRNTAAALVTLLGHDDAARVTPEDVLRFKDHRLAYLHPRTGKPISPKTVKDNDLAGLKALFGWAVANRKLPSNPAAGITIKVGNVTMILNTLGEDRQRLRVMTGRATRNGAELLGMGAPCLKDARGGGPYGGMTLWPAAWPTLSHTRALGTLGTGVEVSTEGRCSRRSFEPGIGWRIGLSSVEGRTAHDRGARGEEMRQGQHRQGESREERQRRAAEFGPVSNTGYSPSLEG